MAILNFHKFQDFQSFYNFNVFSAPKKLAELWKKPKLLS